MTAPSEWSDAIDHVAEGLLTQGDINRPPVDVLELARRIGIDVVFDRRQRVRGRHKKLAGRSSIFLRPDERPERLQWAAAHELGEVVAYRVFERVSLPAEETPPRLREDVANLLASRLLLPSRWFVADARRVDVDLLQLKQLYRTASHELIAYRLLDLDERSVITVFDQGRQTRRLGNREGKPPRLQPVERDCWAEVHRLNRPVEMSAGGLAVRGWPVHENGWKREVMRTTVAWET